jgi:signal transduction histidine kinase
VSRVRLTAQARLTLLFTAAVAVSGVVLTALTYLLMRHNLVHRTIHVELFPPGGDAPAPPLSQLVPDIARQVRDETLSQLLAQAGIALAVITVLAAALGWLVSGRVLRPVRAIAGTARRLSAENLGERVPVTPPNDELAALAGAVNGMLERIQQGVAERDRVLASQRLFAANAAHELRTPLTTMRTAVDVTLDGTPTRAELLAMAGDVRTAIARSQRTLDGLLALAHSQAAPPAAEPLDLADVAASALTGVPAALTVRTDLRPAPARGDPTLLERMAANLVGNAVQHNLPGGDITLSTGTDSGRPFLRIANSGPPVPADGAERLLEPFVRGSADRTGSAGAGLGLSIVHAVVAAHRGEISVTPRPAGGLDVTIRLRR